jgi:hypothetical protein
MSEKSITAATNKMELPAGVGNLAALITVGKSFFGYDLERDGIPDVVVRLYERHGSEGVRAVRLLASTLDPTPKFAEAAALAEWGITHYAGRCVMSKKDAGLSGVWAAKASLVKYHYGSALNEAGNNVDLGFMWSEAVEWIDAAEAAEKSGSLTFVSREDEDSGPDALIEVDMFTGRWERPTPEPEEVSRAEVQRRLAVHDEIAAFLASYTSDTNPGEYAAGFDNGWATGMTEGEDKIVEKIRELMRKGLQ